MDYGDNQFIQLFLNIMSMYNILLSRSNFFVLTTRHVCDLWVGKRKLDESNSPRY